MTDHEEQDEDTALLLLQQEHVEIAMAIYGEYASAAAAAVEAQEAAQPRVSTFQMNYQAKKQRAYTYTLN